MAGWSSSKVNYPLVDDSFDMEDFDETFSVVTRHPSQVKAHTSTLSEVPILAPALMRNGNAVRGSDCASCRSMAHFEKCNHVNQIAKSTEISLEPNLDDSSDDIPLLYTQSNNLLSSGDEGDRLDHCHSNIPERTQTKNAQKRLSIACCLCLVFIAGEIVGGYMSNSLAIMTDAAHLFSDFASFCISLGAIWLSSRQPKKSLNFGYYRAEALGALLTIFMIWVVTGVLLYLAINRLISNSFEVQSTPMMIVAGCAVIFNILIGFILHGAGHVHSHGGSGGHNHSHSQKGGEQHLNIRAAMIHVLGDLIQSIGVLLSSIIIKVKPELKQADPVCTIFFSVIVFCTTVTVLRDTVKILLEGFPRSLSYDEIFDDLNNLSEVVNVHDLRVWCLTTDRIALTAHLAINAGNTSPETVVQKASFMLKTKYKIYLTTIQVEDYKSQVMSSCDQCQLTMK